MPLGARLVFALAVAGLAVLVAYVATGQVGRAAASVGSVVGGFFGAVTTTHSPSPVPVVVSDAPTLTPPVQPETNEATVEVSGTIPAAIVGKTDFSINLYLTVKWQPPARVLQGVPVPLTPTFTISNVKLLKGTNNFTATLKGPGGESGPSKPIAYVLDQTPPAITVTSPAKDATVNGPVATITGKTQARSALLAHNADNLVNVAGSAAVDGSFTIKVPIAPGPNGITLKATDPAGNSTSVVVSVRRGNGKLTVSLTPSAYRVRPLRLHSHGRRHRPGRPSTGECECHLHVERAGGAADHGHRGHGWHRQRDFPNGYSKDATAAQPVHRARHGPRDIGRVR